MSWEFRVFLPHDEVDLRRNEQKCDSLRHFPPLQAPSDIVGGTDLRRIKDEIRVETHYAVNDACSLFENRKGDLFMKEKHTQLIFHIFLKKPKFPV